MKLWIFNILFLAISAGNAHSQNSEVCNGFWQLAMDSLKVRKIGKEPNYNYVLRQLRAYKACDPNSYKKTNEMISKVIKAQSEQGARIIIAAKREREKQKQNKLLTNKYKEQKDSTARQKTIVTESKKIIKTVRDTSIMLKNRATVLSWGSQSQNLNPTEGLKLLENAFKINPDQKLTDYLKLQTQNIFNESRFHQFREKKRFETLKDAAFSPDGKYLLTKDINDKYEFWNLFIHNETLIQKVSLDTSDLNISSNWLWLSKINDNHTIPHKGKLSALIEKENLKFAKLSENGKWIITSSSLYEYNIREFITGRFGYSFGGKRPLFLKDDIILSASFSPNSKWLLIKNSKGVYKLWDVYNNYNQYLFLEENKILDAVFSPDKKWIITVGETNYDNHKKDYRIRSAHDGKKLSFLRNEDGILFNEATSQEREPILFAETSFDYAEFSYNSKWILTREFDSIKFRDIETGKEPTFLRYDGKIINAELSHDGKWLVIRLRSNKSRDYNLKESDYELKLFDLSAGSELKIGAAITNISFSSDSKWIVAEYNRPKLEYKVWEISTMKEPEFITKEKLGISRDVYHLVDIYYDSLGNKSISINSAKVSQAIDAKFVKIYYDSLENKRFYIDEKYTRENIGIKFASFSPDSKLLLVVNGNEEMKIINMLTHTSRILSSKDEMFYKVVFSPDSKWLVTFYGSGNYKVLEVATGIEKLLSDSLRQDITTDAKFSSNSQWIILTKSHPDAQLVFEFASGNSPLFLKDHKSFKAVYFSYDSKFLFTEYQDENKKIWDLTKFQMSTNTNAVQVEVISEDSNYTIVSSHHKVMIKDTTGTLIHTVYINKTPSKMYLTKNHILYILAGKAVIRLELYLPKQFTFSYGDGEELNYSYEEIEEWKLKFKNQYLFPYY